MLIDIKLDFKHIFEYLPKYEHPTDAGMDVCADIPEPLTIYSSTSEVIPTGIYLGLPETENCDEYVWEMQIRPRSGLAAKHGITVLNSPGTIDASYRGEIKIILVNTSLNPYRVNPGDKIAQMVLNKVYKTQWSVKESLTETSRGSGGLGSTGK
jgi:dUTP pyrophosphatase